MNFVQIHKGKIMSESKNLLTDEECEKIAELSEHEGLNFERCCHSFRYYGLNEEERELLKDEVSFLETTLRKWIPDLVTFSNFCNGKNGKRIRCQTRWSNSFQGVSYFDLPNNEPEIVMYKIVDEYNNVIEGLEDLTLEEAEENLTNLLNEGAEVYMQMVE